MWYDLSDNINFDWNLGNARAGAKETVVVCPGIVRAAIDVVRREAAVVAFSDTRFRRAKSTFTS